MDAKPQRPVRSSRVHGDENMPLNMGGQKTLHQRNKSSPALSTMAHLGGLKAAAKRTAFGDVSNTANLSRPSKDDSVIPAKGDYVITEKGISFCQDKKSTALLRPAQRPLSISGLKGLLNNVTNSISSTSGKQPPIDTSQPSQLATQTFNTRKVLTKRSTAIFKDPAPLDTESVAKDLQKPLLPSSTIAPVHRDLVPRQQEKLVEASEPPEPNLEKSLSKRPVEEPQTDAAEPSSVPYFAEEDPVIRSDGIYIDDNGDVQIYRYTDDTYSVEEPSRSIDESVALSIEIKKAYPEAHSNQLQELPVVQSEPEVALKQKPAAISEPEEYWEDEELEENYDEEGYMTARSYKSLGNNTTSGATTVLFPKVNPKVKKELAAAKALVEGMKTAEEIEDETWDTSMVAEYGDEIFQYMRELEIKMLPNAHYMDNQAEIQWSMRSVLMDWLVQVHHRFGLLPETLFLCVNYIDRFLSCKIVSLAKLQLVGATAIFVAAKYEEINCPSVAEIVYMVDGGYTVDEILKAERFMLSMLQFELGWPGPMSFLRRISKADDYDLETRTLAKYFLEITIMDERFVGSPPSFTAAGAHCLARMMLKKGIWSQAHIYYSNYTYAQLYSLVLLLVECCENPSKHHSAIFDKYFDKRYKRASHYVESEMNKGFKVEAISSHKHGSPYGTGEMCNYK